MIAWQTHHQVNYVNSEYVFTHQKQTNIEQQLSATGIGGCMIFYDFSTMNKDDKFLFYVLIMGDRQLVDGRKYRGTLLSVMKSQVENISSYLLQPSLDRWTWRRHRHGELELDWYFSDSHPLIWDFIGDKDYIGWVI